MQKRYLGYLILLILTACSSPTAQFARVTYFDCAGEFIPSQKVMIVPDRNYANVIWYSEMMGNVAEAAMPMQLVDSNKGSKYSNKMGVGNEMIFWYQNSEKALIQYLTADMSEPMTTFTCKEI